MDLLHGHPVADPYRWLEDPTSPETLQWSEAQDERFAKHAHQWAGRDWLRRRIRELLEFEVCSPPTWRGQRRFFTRRRPEQEHRLLLVAEAGQERTLVDPLTLDARGLTTLDAWSPSQEGDLVAVQTSVAGTEQARLVVLDVTSGRIVDGPIDRVRYSSVAWLPGGEGFYYVRFVATEAVQQRGARADSSHRLHRAVWLHRLGTDPAHDALVFSPDPSEPTRPSVAITPDGCWLSLSISYGTGTRNDLWLADLSAGDPSRPDFVGLQHDEEVVTGLHVGRDGRLYLLTDRGAPRRRLCVCTPQCRAPSQWRELIPERSDANLEEFVLLDDPGGRGPQLLVAWTRHAVTELTFHDGQSGEKLGLVDLPGRGTAEDLVSRPEGDDQAWFLYTDPVTPPSVWCYQAGTRTARPWGQPAVAVRPPPVHSLTVDYPSDDGTLVRLSLLAAVPAPDRPRPTILHAYGGFGHQRRPRFAASVLAWVEAGGVYAVAHVRGGGEQGSTWHHTAVQDGKQKTFNDVAAAAHWLVDNGWTSVERLCLSGGSNGGLVMGAVLTQQPELCNAVVALAPLLDMVRYEHHGLGALWTREYGTTAEPEQLGWLLAYSPYHRVKPGVHYPATLFIVFDEDSRVDPLHARKMCAALQWATASDRPILLRREANVGHSDRALSRAITLAADALAFAGNFTGLCFPNLASNPRRVSDPEHQKGGETVDKDDLLISIEEKQQSDGRETPQDGGGQGGDGYFDYV